MWDAWFDHGIPFSEYKQLTLAELRDLSVRLEVRKQMAKLHRAGSR